MYIHSCTFLLLSCELEVVLVDRDDLTYKHLPSTGVSYCVRCQHDSGNWTAPVLEAKPVIFTGLEEFIEVVISVVKCFL